MKRTHGQFSPERYEKELTAVIRELLRVESFDQATYERILRQHPKDGEGFFSKSDLIRGFRHLNQRLGWNLEERPFLDKLRLKPVRTQSGVAPVTVLTQPYPCPGRCIFCPSDVQMPKSYLSSEPGAQRAAQHQFDPYEQSLSRLRTYHNNGHSVDKIELIILGGTWSSYPASYKIWFVKRCLEAMNDSAEHVLGAPPSLPSARSVDFRDIQQRVDGRRIGLTYNDVVTGFLQQRPQQVQGAESATWKELQRAQAANERAPARCVGLVVETRPDELTLDETVRIRRLGATKVQIGYQSLSDEVLRLNHRGHDVAATRRAMRLLREAGFKTHAHWMPNLLGSSPEEDLKDFTRIFDDPGFRPDELKIYPCSLVQSAELMTSFEKGLWRPYDEGELLEVVIECLRRTPEYCRVTRVVRDIPGPDIVAGSRITNLRELAERTLRDRGQEIRDIRAREIKHHHIDVNTLQLRTLEYATAIGREMFLQFVTPEDRIVGFLRLSLPQEPVRIPEIRDSAMIREVHVYGLLAAIGRKHQARAQHLGLGKALIEEAVRIAAEKNFEDLAVISSIGTRQYYRRLGFRDGPLYQHRSL